jgi:hypothetical protein
MVACRAVFIVAPVLYVMLIGTSVSLGLAQPRSGSSPLSVEEVVKLSQGGLSEELIITRIKKNGKPFDLSTDEILELKKLGVSDTVVKFLLDPSQPYAPPPPPKPPEPPPAPPPKPAPTRKYPDDPYASRVPGDPGLYHFTQDSPVRVEIKMLLGEKGGVGLGKVVLKKPKVTAYLVGASSKVRIPEGAPAFYVRLPEGKGIEELVLVALERKDDRRELDLGPLGPKPELKPEALRQFDSLEVGAGLYRLNPVKLTNGEFLFYLISTAEPAKGTYGKGYDFGVGSVLGKKH